MVERLLSLIDIYRQLLMGIGRVKFRGNMSLESWHLGLCLRVLQS